MKLIKNLDGVNKIWRKQYIIIINVLRITDCDENRDARLICFSARFINHFYLFVDEREDIQKRSFTKWINSQLSKVRLKTSTSNSDITDSEVLEVVRMNYDKFYIIILDGGSKYSIFSNIGNCHYLDELYQTTL